MKMKCFIENLKPPCGCFYRKCSLVFFLFDGNFSIAAMAFSLCVGITLYVRISDEMMEKPYYTIFTADRAALPRYRRAIVQHRAALPRYRRTIVQHRAALPRYRRTIVQHRAALPRYRRAIVQHLTTLPRYRRTIVQHLTTLPRYRRTIVQHLTTLARYCRRNFLDNKIYCGRYAVQPWHRVTAHIKEEING